MHDLPADLSFLESGGEMARRVVALDWSSTQVGPIEGWPAGLRTAVGICLSSRHPMVIWWGPDLVLLYNDAWVPILGPAKHPALGRPGESVWPEMWHIIGKQLRGVLETGEATWSDDQLLPAHRFGYLEEAYFTYSYSAIRDESGRVAGVFTAVTETTSRVLGERRLGTLRELGEVSASQSRSVDEACRAIIDVLARNRADLPFASIHLCDTGDGIARLVASQGLVEGHDDHPRLVTREQDPWSVWDVVDSGAVRVTRGVAERCAGLLTPGWSTMSDTLPDAVVALPIAASGSDDTAGVLLAGVSPHRALDEDYLSFLSLVAGHVSTAVADARAYDHERRRAQALAELDRAKTEFFSNVSHEFRTPLTLIAGPAEDGLADDANPLAPVQRERLETIRRNAARLRRLVNDLLDFSRIEAGRARPESVETELGGFTSGIVASFAPAVRRAGLELRTDFANVEGVFVDRDMWEKIVLNLLSNALKFTLRGQIDVALRTRRDGVELRIADTGVGIAAHEIPQLFQRFHRVRSAEGRSHEGSGIGLALVHQLVTLHGGMVSVQSEPGVGTAFTVWIPRRGVPNTAAPITDAPSTRPNQATAYLEEALRWEATDPGAPGAPPSHPLPGSTPGARVLVVDDNADLRQMLVRLLSPYWQVLVAADGRQALELARAERPDLVLSDVMMPRLDGFGLLEALRSDPATATIPVILLSARAGEEAEIQGLDAGADDYLVKPFSSLELLARVRSNLELARSRNHESAWRSALVAAIQDGVFITDPSGAVIEVNAAFEALTGYDQHGTPYTAAHPWWPDAEADGEHRDNVEAAIASALVDGRSRIEAPFRHRDGHRVWISLSLDALDDPRTGDRMLVGTARDITPQLRSIDRAGPLARLTARLAQSSDVHDVLVAGLAELRKVWSAKQVVEASWDAGGRTDVLADPPVPSWESLPEDMRSALDHIRRDHGLHVEPDDSLGAGTQAGAAVPTQPSVGMGAPIGDRTAVWVHFDPPRLLSADDRALFGVLCDYLGLALQRARLFDDQHEVATVLQRAILSPVQLPDGLAARYLPAERPLEVGGDWYDVVDLGQGVLGLVVGDCVGRGLHAATVMGQLRSAAQALLLQAKSPGEVLGVLDEFALRIPGARCTTVFCALIDIHRHTVRYSSAGHPPALLVDAAGGAELLEQAGSVPLATIPVATRPEATATLAPGSTLLLYTDGLVERRGRGLEVGLDLFAASAVANRDLAPDALADEIIDRLLSGESGADDVALLVYRHPPRAADEFRVFLPADPARLAPLRRDLRLWLVDVGLDEEAVDDVLLVVCEACTNSIEHAYGSDPTRVVVLDIRHDPDGLLVVVRDTGSWKPPTDAPTTRGRGVAMMRAMMDSVDIDHRPDGTTVTMRKRLGDDR
ncbi:SpoIIE family protein phosphatase [Saccharothrix hoggarensis]|uniref:histidine kinase n=1 Tax=Saccharothrix hoggarensis TaxID=913853 RepID=A0ABW3QUI5_9PSEU